MNVFFISICLKPVKVPHLEELTSVEADRLTAMQTSAMCERVNDILHEFHAIRYSDDRKNTHVSALMDPPVFSSSRLLIKSMPLDGEHVKQLIISKLSSEQEIAVEVGSGRKDISEAMNVDFIVKNFEEGMQDELVVLGEDITSALIAATIDGLAEEIKQMEENVL